NALEASRLLAADPLLRRIFGDETSAYRARAAPIDASFNRIVGAFAKRDRLVELYDFLRDTGQTGRAGWIAEQYELRAALKAYYRERVEQAVARFAEAGEPLAASPAYFAEVCKLAELHDSQGDWAAAKDAYAAYLEAFPDELGLVLTLSDVAEATGELDEAVEWEERAIECKRRLSRNARAWSLRELRVLPRIPSALESRMD